MRVVKHIILWKLKEEAKGANLQKNVDLLQGKFKALLGVVDGLTAIEVGINYNGGPADIALYCEFESKEAEVGYQSHPDHIAIKAIVKDLVCERNCIDYEI